MPTTRKYEFDVPAESLPAFLLAAERFRPEVVTMSGPGGGNPCVGLSGSTQDVEAFAAEHYEPSYGPDDVACHLAD